MSVIDQMLEQLQRMDPNSPAYRNALGWLQKATGDSLEGIIGMPKQTVGGFIDSFGGMTGGVSPEAPTPPSLAEIAGITPAYGPASSQGPPARGVVDDVRLRDFYGGGEFDDSQTAVGDYDTPPTLQTDYASDPGLGDGFHTAVGELDIEQKRRIVEQAMAKGGGGGIPVEGGSFMGGAGSQAGLTVDGMDIDEYNRRGFAELEDSFAKRRIRELQARGGQSGSQRDQKEMAILLDYQHRKDYADSIKANAIMQAQASAAATEGRRDAAENAMQYEMYKDSIKRQDRFYDNAADTADSLIPGLSAKVRDIEASTSLTAAAKVAAVESLLKAIGKQVGAGLEATSPAIASTLSAFDQEIMGSL